MHGRDCRRRSDRARGFTTTALEPTWHLPSSCRAPECLPHHYAAAPGGMALGAAVEGGPAEGDALVDRAVVADLRGFMITTPMPWSMNASGPIFAPRWISIPVSRRPT